VHKQKDHRSSAQSRQMHAMFERKSDHAVEVLWCMLRNKCHAQAGVAHRQKGKRNTNCLRAACRDAATKQKQNIYSLGGRQNM
jgi:hypothetical protein